MNHRRTKRSKKRKCLNLHFKLGGNKNKTKPLSEGLFKNDFTYYRLKQYPGLSQAVQCFQLSNRAPSSFDFNSDQSEIVLKFLAMDNDYKKANDAKNKNGVIFRKALADETTDLFSKIFKDIDFKPLINESNIEDLEVTIKSHAVYVRGLNPIPYPKAIHRLTFIRGLVSTSFVNAYSPNPSKPLDLPKQSLSSVFANAKSSNTMLGKALTRASTKVDTMIEKTKKDVSESVSDTVTKTAKTVTNVKDGIKSKMEFAKSKLSNLAPKVAINIGPSSNSNHTSKNVFHPRANRTEKSKIKCKCF